MAAKEWIWFLFAIFRCIQAQNAAGGGGESLGRDTYTSSNINMEKFRQELLYPHENNDLLLRITQSNSLHDAPLVFRLPFFGFEYRYVWIHRDGYILFNKGLLFYKKPITFPTPFLSHPERSEDPSLIAPWFSRQDIPNEIEGAGLYFRLINMGEERNKTLKERIRLDFKDGMIGSSDFEPKYAFIVTWKNVSHPNRQDDRDLRTNTYQAVIATDEQRTYAMFNYAWLTWFADKDTFDGTKGVAPFIGFNAGNRTRAYEFEPYSQQPRVSSLTSLGFGNGLPGRFFFQIDEEIWPGCCIERHLDINWRVRPKLTFFPRYGSMLGGTMVNITGPCFLNPRSNIRCKFDTLETKGYYRDKNHVSCISPPIMYHGYVIISVSIDNGPFLFSGKYYVQPPDMVKPDVTALDGMDREENPERMIITWDALKLTWNMRSPISISIWGYRENHENYPKLTYIDSIAEGSVTNGDMEYEIDLEAFKTRWNTNKLDIHFGFIAINLTNPSDIGKGIRESPVLWSRPMPLSWYFRPQWIRKYGSDWKKDMCEDWYTREKYSDRFAITLFRCPCTLDQARLDRGRYAPDLQCNEIDRKCESFHKAAYHCVRSGRPAVGGAGQLCCYDDHGELIRTGDTMYGGRPSRSFQFGKHPFKQKMMVPALSNWLHDISPFFYCCKWAEGEDDSDTCALFKYWRTSQDCSLYQPPGVASVFGDPHYVTFDRVNYTFNGKGEFSLVRVNNPMHKLDVHGRFEQPPQSRIGDPAINGTRLTAVAARDNISSIVEFRVRPSAARWQYHMYIIVDQEYVYFWDNSLRVQYFKGVTLYQPANVYNMSHIVAMFDSGAGVEVMVENGHMAVHVYLPLTYINKTAGLLGNWSRIEDDEFTTPTGDLAVQPNAKTYDIHQRFGIKWRLTTTEDPLVGKSLFDHNPISFAEFDNASFIPEYNVPPSHPENFHYTVKEVEETCSGSTTCTFDFYVTGDRDFAVATKHHENYAQKLASDAREPVVRCNELPKPRNGRKSEIRYYIGTTVRFTCDDGYRLVGYENRKCRISGLWSWGVDPECISESDYKRKVVGISLGIVLPIIIIGILVGFCIIRNMRSRKNHWTGEKGMFTRPVMEMKSNAHRNGIDSDSKLEKEV